MSMWKIDEEHSTVNFKIKHMGIAWVSGQFSNVKGSLEFDKNNFDASKITAILDTNKISTGSEMRDGHLKSADFFDSEKFPEAKFESTKFHSTMDNKAKVIGEIEIKGIKKEVEFEVEFTGETEKLNNAGEKIMVAGFYGQGEIDRTDFEINWNVDLPAGNKMLGNKVILEINIEAVLQ